MSAARETAPPFGAALAVRALGDGTYTVELPGEWTVGGKPHGGFLSALLAKAAVDVRPGDGPRPLEPLAVSAQFLRPPGIGPALLRTEVRKTGRRVTVVSVHLEQRGRTCVEAMVTTGHLPRDRAAWTDLPNQPPEPPGNAVELATLPSANVVRIATACDVRLDPHGAGFLHGQIGDPLRLRLWVRPHGEQPEPLFALVAGDIAMPVTFNLGRLGWSPTVQMTSLVRSRPSPGWLRVQVDCRAVHGMWFDADATVVDSTGRLVCQARQLALSTVT
ncbi:acyl-coenzyme A thioesterase PaaI-like protein [Herbihabitans rhizosphaerae]|uniref:Acyl-coenzyme A thioesterase PaaI-like protein n=1 Tax=Herbihabitans rhizosphaerae TaxID=1872711 RepID=A0A4Q7L5M9_9PSEU|nr:thioesterase family protein [Herbihabitans rhizosphaerae]RZS44584.1 acyl-coenzyme A thioesterase PaaI-like protein [Herbihabitans rhizosphaerae]